MVISKSSQVIIYIILTLIIIFTGTYYHELVHKQIQIYYGCEESSIHFKWSGAYTSCDKVSVNYTCDSHDKEYELHSLNEIVTYNIDALMLMIFLIGLIIIIK